MKPTELIADGGRPFFALNFIVCLLSGAACQADIIYISNWNGGNIQRFDSVTGANLGVFTYMHVANGLAFDAAGDLYVGNWASQSIVKFAPDGSSSVFGVGLQGVEGLAVDKAGNLFVGNVFNNTIMKFTPSGTASVFASTGLNHPEGLAFDSGGNLYVANRDGNNVVRFTPDGVGSVFVNSYNPYGLAFDSAGNLFAASYFGDLIRKYTPSGIGSNFAISGLTGPAGIAFDSAGNLFVINEQAGPGLGNIREFTPDGVSSIFSTAVNEPIFIAIIPEPSALALFGLAIPALTLPRRRLK